VIDVSDLSGTPNKILRDVLMMPSLTPVWAEEKIKAAIEGASGSTPQEIAKQVFDAMRQIGMGENLQDFSKDDGATQ